MRRDELEHVIRAAADVTQESEIVVLGSQAILGQFPDAPPSLLTSQEVDVYPRHDPDKAIAIDGALGDGSTFHQTFGYYAHGVGPETAKAPAGWETRLVRVRVQSTSGNAGDVTGWCLEAHDVVLAKCVAGRDRDWEYAAQAIRDRVVRADELLRRVPDLPISGHDRDGVERMLRGIVQRATRNPKRRAD